MTQVELLLGLMLAVAVLVTVARRMHVAYPILLVLGGLVLGLIPGLPPLELPPDVIFLLFVPPLVYIGAVSTPWRDFRANLRPIVLLAVGLVLGTVLGVAAAVHWVFPEISWPVAFVLATIVAPTDAVAVMAITRQLRVPRRITTILEGEGLLNDATALVAYRMAVAAVVAGTFSLDDACVSLVWVSVGGTLVGLAIGWITVQVRRLLHDPPVEVTLSLLTPFAAYLPAEAMGVSGVVAVVAAGIYIGRRGTSAFAVDARSLSYSVWQIVDFLLNGLAFILIGLQLQSVYEGLKPNSPLRLVAFAALVSAAVIGIRIVWVLASAYVPRYFSARLRKRDPAPIWQHLVIVAWSGMRGVDSLTVALALPFITADGKPFPHRPLVVFLAFSVILVTLLLQGLTLPLLIRLLGLRDDGIARREESEGRHAAARAALQRLEELANEPWLPPEAAEHLRALYKRRQHRFHAQLARDKDRAHEAYAQATIRLQLELLHAERAAILNLRQNEVISDDAYREIERDLDLEELRLAP
jgi:Na+/H+ antiporter